MLVKEWMSTTVITVDPGASIAEAIQLQQTHNRISLLPVVQEGKLVGVVTDSDLKPFSSHLPSTTDGASFWGTLVLTRIKVEDIMSRAPVTIPMDYSVEEAADVLLNHKIPGVAVVDESNRIVGVLTQTDINRVLVSVTGLRRGGIVYGFLLADKPGAIKGLTDIMRSYGGRLASILTSYERSPKGYRKVSIRVRTLDRSKLPTLEHELSARAKVLYKIDFRENTRQIFEDDAPQSESVALK